MRNVVLRYAPAVVVASIISLALIGVIGNYGASLLVYIGISAIVAIGLTLLTGVGGMTSFGQAAFVGIGAYAAAVLNIRFGLSAWVTLPCALVITGIAAVLIGGITVRLAGHYLPLGTIAWGLSIYFAFGNAEWLGGHDGLRGVQPIYVGNSSLTDPKSFLILVWSGVALAVFFTSNILRSRVGRALRSLREDSAAADAFGVNADSLKLAVFIYAALLAGFAGWLYVCFQRSVAPGSFGIVAGIEYLLMVVIGGPGHVLGAIVGSAMITLVRDQLQNVLPSIVGPIGNYETVVFGCLIIAVLQTSQSGIGPFLFGFIKQPFPRVSKASDLPTRDLGMVAQCLLSVRNLSKRFGGLVAVKDTTFDVPRASVVGLIGPNGAGKSTTFNLIAGALSANNGEIELNGTGICFKRAREIARLGLARTFQHPHVALDMTVVENVMLGAHLRGDAGFVQAMLRLNQREEQQLFAAAIHQIRRVGLEKVALSPAGHLSLGELRLLEIGRALCLDPVLLLLDEPAAGLRVAEKRSLAQLLRELRKQGLSILLVEHDMPFVMGLVDELVVLDFGTMIAKGKPAEVQKDAAVLKAYLGSAV